jgi:hypothetical protein
MLAVLRGQEFGHARRMAGCFPWSERIFRARARTGSVARRAA